MNDKYIYFNHGKKIYTVVNADTFLMIGECRPYNAIELRFASNNNYREVSKHEYKMS